MFIFGTDSQLRFCFVVLNINRFSGAGIRSRWVDDGAKTVKLMSALSLNPSKRNYYFIIISLLCKNFNLIMECNCARQSTHGSRAHSFSGRQCKERVVQNVYLGFLAGPVL